LRRPRLRPRVPDVDTNTYTLGPGDQIRIITFGEQQLTGEFRVDAAGEIALPLVGDVHAGGLTPKQLEGAGRPDPDPVQAV
jgi:polysaccharide export outer membrane protein